MFAGINVCLFETKPCSRGLIFAVRSGLVNYLGNELCLREFILRFKNAWSRNLSNKSLANINEFTDLVYCTKEHLCTAKLHVECGSDR